MPYTPNQASVYIAAFSGSLAGIAASGKFLLDAAQSDYVYPSQQADALAQAVDTVWGVSPTVTVAGLQQLTAVCAAVWQAGRSPIGADGGRSTLPSSYMGLAQAIVATAKAGTAQIVFEGIDPNAGGGSGSTGPTGPGGSAGPSGPTGPGGSTGSSGSTGPTGASGGVAVPGFTSDPGFGGVATSQTLSSGNITIGASGTITWIAQMTITSVGGTSSTGEAIVFTAFLDGAAISPTSIQSAATVQGAIAAGTVIAKVTGLTPGSTHTVGVQATNASAPTHTFNSSGSQVTWLTP